MYYSNTIVIRIVQKGDMMFSIRNPEAESLARQMAAELGVGVTQVVLEALRDKREREPAIPEYRSSLIQALTEIADSCSRLPTLDDRPMDEILGYDEDGLFEG